jgi:hypothetical protein
MTLTWPPNERGSHEQPKRPASNLGREVGPVKKLIAVSVATVCLVLPPFAAADYLTMTRAHHAEHKYMRGLCKHDNQCHHYGVLYCKRRSDHRVDCKSYTENRDRHGRYTCKVGHKWTNKKGRLHVATSQSPKCMDGWTY